MNIFRSRIARDELGNLTLDVGGQSLALGADLRQRYRDLNRYLARDLLVGLRPEAFTVAPTDTDKSIAVEVKTVEVLGHETIVYATASIDKIDTDEYVSGQSTDSQANSILIARVASSHPIQVGHQLALTVDASKLYLFSIDGKPIE